MPEATFENDNSYLASKNLLKATFLWLDFSSIQIIKSFKGFTRVF